MGCGHKVLGLARVKDEKELVSTSGMAVGVDYNLTSLINHRSIRYRIRADIQALPFDSGAFDLVSANMVVEHLQHPEAQFKEISRILRRQGRFILHTPNVYGYQTVMGRVVPEIFKNKFIHFLHGRNDDDIFPTYYKANTRNRILKLADEAGLNPVKVEMKVSGAQFVMVPPVAFVELIWLRCLLSERLRALRNNMVAVLEKN